MDLLSGKLLKMSLKKYGVCPSKRFGQNFLIDGSVLKKIVEAANLISRDQVLEIGPGTGFLTFELARKAKKVIVIEKDLRMVKILENSLKNFKNIEIITGDVLKIPDTKYKILNTRYKVVANLPYYIATSVIRKFLESALPPKEMILTIQKEVAQRICARPPKMNLLAVSVQFYAKVKIISFISKKSFWPRPKVDGAIVKIVPKSKKINKYEKQAIACFLYGTPARRKLFFRIVKAGFSQPRKQLLNNLSTGLKLDKERIRSWLSKNNIQPTQRPETLSIDDWVNLAKNFVS